MIAPAGLFVVDAKHYDGRLRIRDKGGLFRTDYRLYVGGRDCSHLADNMAWQVQAVETLLASVEITMPVTPVLCFIDVDWPLLFAPNSFRGVRVEDPKSLRKLIACHAGPRRGRDRQARPHPGRGVPGEVGIVTESAGEGRAIGPRRKPRCRPKHPSALLRGLLDDR